MPVVNINQVDEVEYVDDEEQTAEADERTGQFLVTYFGHCALREMELRHIPTLQNV